MDRVTKSLLNEFSTEHGLEKLDEDSQFEHFAAYLTIGRHLGDGDEIADLVIGSGGDTGIDALAIVVNGVFIEDAAQIDELVTNSGHIEASFLFVQAERSSSFDMAKIGQFSFGVSDFFKEKPALQRNRQLNRAAQLMTTIYNHSSRFKRGRPTCKMFYVTTGTWVEDGNLVARKNSAVQELLDTKLFATVDFIPLGADDIQDIYRESKNSISREFEFALRTVVPTVTAVSEAYIGLLPATEFLPLISDTRGDILKGIFYDNVRDWQDFNAVNSEMRGTLADPTSRSRFALMNNGVTIIAKTLRATANRFYIEDYQIVNGCQTSHVLFDRREVLDSTVMVPLRLIATKDDDVIASIIVATNRQTEVREEQLLALSSFQKKLEAFFSSFDEPQRLYYERRSRQYHSVIGVEKTRIVTPGSLIRAFASMFLEEPHRATKSYRRILDRAGKDLFGANDKLDPYYVAALAMYRLEYLFRNQFLDKDFRAARYEILLALRWQLMPAPLPRMNSNDMERKCRIMIDALWDNTESEGLFRKAAALVNRAAGGSLDATILRTEGFTEHVLKRCKMQAQRNASNKAIPHRPSTVTRGKK